MKILVLILSLFILGCNSKTTFFELLEDIRVPEDAYDIRKVNLNEITQQLFFRIDMSFPDMSVLNQYDNYLTENDWLKCTGYENGWKTFYDSTTTRAEPILVHQILEYWINRKNSFLLTLSVTYYSNELNIEVPDNNQQNVVIWMQESSNLSEDLVRLSISC